MRLITRLFMFLSFSLLAGCSAKNMAPKQKDETTSETKWGYAKLPYEEWSFLFIYPRSLPALATQALMVDGSGYATTYQYLDITRASNVSVGRWNEHLGVTQSYYNKGKSLPLMLRFCWDSIIDKKTYETQILFKQDTWEQMTKLYRDSYHPDESYYRDTMIIGLAPGGKVSVWLDDLGDPVVIQNDAKIATVSGENMNMCKGVTKHPNGYVYYGDTPEFIKGKTYPYGNW